MDFSNGFSSSVLSSEGNDIFGLRSKCPFIYIDSDSVEEEETGGRLLLNKNENIGRKYYNNIIKKNKLARASDDSFSDELSKRYKVNPANVANNRLENCKKTVKFSNFLSQEKQLLWKEKEISSSNSRLKYPSSPVKRGFNDHSDVCTLPTIGFGRSDAIKRISHEVMAELIEKKIDRDYQAIDARYSYEYDGGHIPGAINIRENSSLLNLIAKPKIYIFYCEFSSVRGPTLAKALRKLDRELNVYPNLSCPEIYILEGGYSKFYKYHRELCTPLNYIKMEDPRFRWKYLEEQKKNKIKK